jgi:hypothetical protein
VTTPGSALLFPSLCVPTGDLPAADPARIQPRCGDRTALVPERRRTRAQNRAHRIATERRQNRHARESRQAHFVSYSGPPPPEGSDDELAPF